MSGAGKTQAVSVHKFRRRARAEERRLQGCLRHGGAFGEPWPEELPDWTRGVRVERIGKFCHAVIATEERGH
jgi:hypothetical protein